MQTSERGWTLFYSSVQSFHCALLSGIIISHNSMFLDGESKSNLASWVAQQMLVTSSLFIYIVDDDNDFGENYNVGDDDDAI